MAVLPARRRLMRGHDFGAAKNRLIAGKSSARFPAGKYADRLCRLPLENGLAAASGDFLSAARTPPMAIGRRVGDNFGRHFRDSLAGTQRQSVAVRWLALVFGNVGAGDWPGAGRFPGDGRPLHLFPAGRDFSGDDLFSPGLGRSFHFFENVDGFGGRFNSWRVFSAYGKATALLA